MPKQVTSGLTFTQLSASEGPTCGVTTSGDIYCWGSQNDAGQLGIGTFDTDTHPAPELVVGGLTFRSVSAGVTHACGITTTDAAYCWGSNVNGELGATAVETCSFGPCSTTPMAVSGGLTFRAIAAGSQYTCGVDTSGQAYCWGGGPGGIGGGNATPSALGVGIDFVALSGGGAHLCGVSSSDLAYCWGHNWNGSVGNGDVSGDVSEPSSCVRAAVVI